MQPSRLFRIDDLLEDNAPANDDAAPDRPSLMHVPTAAELSRQILRLAAMATVEHQRITRNVDACAAENAPGSSAKRAA